jgi:hypothetical protein
MSVVFLKNLAKDSSIAKVRLLGLLVPDVAFESIYGDLLLRFVVWAEVGPEVVPPSFLLIVLSGDTAAANERQWCF